jgi:hypothetical protein
MNHKKSSQPSMGGIIGRGFKFEHPPDMTSVVQRIVPNLLLLRRKNYGVMWRHPKDNLND